MAYHHKLNRGDDRHADPAIRIMAIERRRTDERTKEHVVKR